jgi:hypothetical protein
MRKSNRPQHKIDKEYEEIGIPCKNGELYQVALIVIYLY